MTQIRLDETFHYEFDDSDYYTGDDIELITVKESAVNWEIPEYPFNYPIDRLARAICLEFTKDGKIDYASADFIYGPIRIDSRDIQNTIELCGYNGWTPTGRAIFRGYFDVDPYDDTVTEIDPSYIKTIIE